MAGAGSTLTVLEASSPMIDQSSLNELKFNGLPSRTGPRRFDEPPGRGSRSAPPTPGASAQLLRACQSLL